MLMVQNFLGVDALFRLKTVNPASRPLPSCSFPILFLMTIGGTNNRDNTDDVGFVSQRWVLTPPKGLGNISTLVVRSSCFCATMPEHIGLSSIILVMTSKAFFDP